MTRMLTEHDDIRDWAAARAGSPALSWANTVAEDAEPTLMLLFGQQSYQDQDEGADRPIGVGDIEIVEWDEWFRHFDRLGLGLVVADETPNMRDQFHEIVARKE